MNSVFIILRRTRLAITLDCFSQSQKCVLAFLSYDFHGTNCNKCILLTAVELVEQAIAHFAVPRHVWRLLWSALGEADCAAQHSRRLLFWR